MSQKFATVEHVIAAMNERDVAAYMACCTDDVELVPVTAAVTGTYAGKAGIRAFFADLQDSAPDIHVRAEKFELVGGDVLASERASASGRVSGIVGELEFATLYEFAGDRVASISVFLERAEALRAARPSE